MSFFFQAEDGIRVHCVTGVQTCALPILLIRVRFTVAGLSPQLCCRYSRYRVMVGVVISAGPNGSAVSCPAAVVSSYQARSEERRVGKECRCGGCAADEKES